MKDWALLSHLCVCVCVCVCVYPSTHIFISEWLFYTLGYNLILLNLFYCLTHSNNGHEAGGGYSGVDSLPLTGMGSGRVFSPEE